MEQVTIPGVKPSIDEVETISDEILDFRNLFMESVGREAEIINELLTSSKEFGTIYRVNYVAIISGNKGKEVVFICWNKDGKFVISPWNEI